MLAHGAPHGNISNACITGTMARRAHLDTGRTERWRDPNYRAGKEERSKWEREKEERGERRRRREREI